VGGRVEAERLAREAGGDQRLEEAERRERVLAARLEDDGDLHDRGRQPEGVDAGGVAREQDAEALGLREEVYVEPALADETVVEQIERHAAREAGEDGADVGHGSVDLAHVEAAEAVGQAGELGKRGGVVIRALQAIAGAPGEVAVEEEIGGLLAAIGERGARDCLQTLDAAGNEREVAPNQAGVGHADFENLAAEVELDAVEALVGAAEAEDGNVNRSAHGRAVRL
jgi:hypothetical protein